MSERNCSVMLLLLLLLLLLQLFLQLHISTATTAATTNVDPATDEAITTGTATAVTTTTIILLNTFIQHCQVFYEVIGIQHGHSSINLWFSRMYVMQ